MDGMPEDQPTRSQVRDLGEDRVRAGQLATAAAGLTVGHAGGRPSLTATRVTELADAITGDRG